MQRVYSIMTCFDCAVLVQPHPFALSSARVSIIPRFTPRLYPPRQSRMDSSDKPCTSTQVGTQARRLSRQGVV